jgi:hypothetical protein
VRGRVDLFQHSDRNVCVDLCGVKPAGGAPLTVGGQPVNYIEGVPHSLWFSKSALFALLIQGEQSVGKDLPFQHFNKSFEC